MKLTQQARECTRMEKEADVERLNNSVWQYMLALVAMKLTQQARECTKMEKETGVESGACDQEKFENNELCRKFRR